MATSITKAGILGGITLFIWGALSWMVLPWHTKTIHSFTDEAAITQLIQSNAPISGMYFSPAWKQNDTAKDKAQMQGPMVFASVRLEGISSSMTVSMIISFLTQAIAAFFVAWLLSKTKGLNYLERVGFVVIFALAAGIVTDIPYWNWFAFDMQYTLVAMADLLIGWFFAGLVLAKFCKK